jgi:hypothetical protein
VPDLIDLRDRLLPLCNGCVSVLCLGGSVVLILGVTPMLGGCCTGILAMLVWVVASSSCTLGWTVRENDGNIFLVGSSGSAVLPCHAYQVSLVV